MKLILVWILIKDIIYEFITLKKSTKINDWF
jgi:hypothetical protein